MSSIEEILARDGRLIYTIKGISMLPMLHQMRDVVAIFVPDGPLQKYDVALYKRGKQYVLHRVIRVKDNYYLIRGDNTYAMETVPKENVIGILKAFTRKGKSHTVQDIDYKCYVRFWCAIYPIRLFYKKCRWRLGRIARKLGIRRPVVSDKKNK